MALYDLIYTQKLPISIPFKLGNGLTALPNKYAITGFGIDNNSTAFFDFNNNLNYINKITTPIGLFRIQYNEDDNSYWGLSPYENKGVIYHFDINGNTIKSLNLEDIIPIKLIPDKIANAFTLSPDKTKIFVMWENNKGIFTIGIDGSYLGYTNFLYDETIVNGLTTDGENVWACAHSYSTTFKMYKLDANLNIVSYFVATTPDNVWITPSNFEDITFDKYNFAPKCAIAIRTVPIDMGNDEMYVIAYEVPCPGVQPCENPPIILADNVCLQVGDKFEPCNYVKAFDCDGADITPEVIITQNNVDTSKSGKYNVTYQVTSLNNGKTSEKTIIVMVVESDKRHQAITDLIQSLALEQTALSHILNAEGEKSQKVTKIATTKSEIINTNNSITDMVTSITKLENILNMKLSLFDDCLKCENENSNL